MGESYREWGRNIRAGRKVLGLTQAALAALLDTSQQTVCRWESGANAPRDSQKVRVAEVLHQDVRQLFPLTRRPVYENEQQAVAS